MGQFESSIQLVHRLLGVLPVRIETRVSMVSALWSLCRATDEGLLKGLLKLCRKLFALFDLKDFEDGLKGTYRWRNIGYILTESRYDACDGTWLQVGLATVASVELNQIYSDAETNKDDVCSRSDLKAETAQVPRAKEI